MPLLKKFSISQLDTKSNAALQTDFSVGMAALINARAILYQVIPQLTIVTILVCNMSATPLFVRNTEIARHLPDLIAWTAYEDCKEELTENWATILQVTYFFVLHSRLIVALVSLYRTALSVGLLYGSVYSWVLSSVCILLPMACVRSFQWVMYLGKAMSVRDVDILAVFCIKPGGLQQREKADEEEKSNEEVLVHKRSRLSFSDSFGASNFFKSSSNDNSNNNSNNNNEASEERVASGGGQEAAANADEEPKQLDEEANKRVSTRPHKLSVTKYQSISSGLVDDEEEDETEARQFNIADFDSDSEKEEEEEEAHVEGKVKRGKMASFKKENEGIPSFEGNDVDRDTKRVQHVVSVDESQLTLTSFFNSALSVTTSVVTLGLVNLDETGGEVGADASFEE